MFFLLLSIVCAQAGWVTPSDPRLAAQINQLIRKELSAGEADSATLSEVRQIYVEHGIPAVAQVGSETAENYVVLLEHVQPTSFVRSVLPALKTAVKQGKMPKSNYVYWAARLRQRQAEEGTHREVSHPEVRDEIEQLFRTNQAVRQKRDFNPKEMAEVDRRNATQERAIYAKYAVPTYRMVGMQAAKDFVVLVEHQPLEFMRTVLPKLKANVDAGEADPSSYASMFDRVQTYTQSRQTYGQNFVCTAEAKLAPAPIQDVAHVDQRRAELGLLPMRLYSKLVVEHSPEGFCEKLATSGKHPNL